MPLRFHLAVLSLLLLQAPATRAATPRDALVMAWNLDALITLDPAQIGEVNGNDIVGNVCDAAGEFRPGQGRISTPSMPKMARNPGPPRRTG